MSSANKLSFWLLLLTLIVTACQSQRQNELFFETIEAENEAAPGGEYYKEQEPRIVIVARLEEISNLNSWISSKALDQLGRLDFESYFAVTVFQGQKPTNRYGVEIRDVTLEDSKVTINAQFLERAADEEAADEVTSPYHLIQVQKNGMRGRSITFELVVSGTIVASVSHYIP
jgi:hypothetical protein